MGDSITGKCETDAEWTATDVGPKTGENPEYGIPAPGGSPQKRAETVGDPSQGEGLTDTDKSKTTKDVGRMSEKGEKSEYDRLT